MRGLIPVLFLWLLGLGACGRAWHEAPAPAGGTHYARLFSLENRGPFRLLTIREPYPGGKPQKWLLVPRNRKPYIPDSLARYPALRVPVRRLVATSVTHLEPLEMLKAGDVLVGFPQTSYIVSDYFRRRVASGQIVDLGREMMPDAERILSLRPEVMLVFSTGADNKDFDLYRRAGIAVVYVSEWMERHPLGRAEWLRVFGALTGRQALADSLFGRIRHSYEHTRDSIARLTERSRRPVVFRGGTFGDKWFVAGGGSWAARLIRDAGGRYVLADTTRQGSVRMNFEDALIYLLRADVWLDPGSLTGRKDVLKEVPQVQKAPFWSNGKIYSVNLKTNDRGQIIFFEKSPMHPDWVLQDLTRIFYRDTSRTGPLHFYARLR